MFIQTISWMTLNVNTHKPAYISTSNNQFHRERKLGKIKGYYEHFPFLQPFTAFLAPRNNSLFALECKLVLCIMHVERIMNDNDLAVFASYIDRYII